MSDHTPFWVPGAVVLHSNQVIIGVSLEANHLTFEVEIERFCPYKSVFNFYVFFFAKANKQDIFFSI